MGIILLSGMRREEIGLDGVGWGGIGFGQGNNTVLLPWWLVDCGLQLSCREGLGTIDPENPINSPAPWWKRKEEEGEGKKREKGRKCEGNMTLEIGDPSF